MSSIVRYRARESCFGRELVFMSPNQRLSANGMENPEKGMINCCLVSIRAISAIRVLVTRHRLQDRIYHAMWRAATGRLTGKRKNAMGRAPRA